MRLQLPAPVCHVITVMLAACCLSPCNAAAEEGAVRGAARDLTLDAKYIILPVENDARPQRFTLSIEGEQVREFTMPLASSEPDWWAFMHTDALPGEEATLRAERLTREQLEWFFAIRTDDTYPGEEDLYNESLRPQLHFSSKRGWNNDPNGLVYFAGEYHLFYQHNPYGWSWGNMTWGHAVSTDLVHWEELGDALHPGQWGAMFSGSAVVDWENTTGFQKGSEPPLVAIYTNAGGTNRWSEGEPFTQGIAYSNDRGRTWTKYPMPVQGHLNTGNRDPKVIWWEDTQEWVIVLYLRDDRMAFFRSKDLKRWEFQSEMDAFHECPELFELPVQGGQGETKWILYGAAGDYFIGDFDGSHYTPEGDAQRFHYGNCFYASQTFNDMPEDDPRRIQIAWGQNDAPGMPFNQMMTYPVTLSLHATDEGLRMYAYPVKEIEKLYARHHVWEDVEIRGYGSEALRDAEGKLFDIEVEIEPRTAEKVGLIVRGERITYDVAEEELVFRNAGTINSAPLALEDGHIRLRCIVDRTSIEIFANGGRIYMPCRFRPAEDAEGIALYARGGTAAATTFHVRELTSIWE